MREVPDTADGQAIAAVSRKDLLECSEAGPEQVVANQCRRRSIDLETLDIKQALAAEPGGNSAAPDLDEEPAKHEGGARQNSEFGTLGDVAVHENSSAEHKCSKCKHNAGAGL